MSFVKTIGLLTLLAVSPALVHGATVTVRFDDIMLPYSDAPRIGTFDVYVRVVGDDPPQVIGQSVHLELLDTGGGLVFSSVGTPSTGPHPTCSCCFACTWACTSGSPTCGLPPGW